MTCSVCSRPFEKDKQCPIHYEGGPKAGQFVEWYETRDIQGGKTMTLKTGLIFRAHEDTVEVRRGASGTGKKMVLGKARLARVVR